MGLTLFWHNVDRDGALPDLETFVQTCADTLRAHDNTLLAQDFDEFKQRSLAFNPPHTLEVQQTIGWVAASLFVGRTMETSADMAAELLMEDLRPTRENRGAWTCAWLEQDPCRLIRYSLYDAFWEQFLDWIEDRGLDSVLAGQAVARMVDLDLSRKETRHPIDDTELLCTLDPLVDYINETTLRQLAPVIQRHPGGSVRLLAKLHRQQLLDLGAQTQKVEPEARNL